MSQSAAEPEAPTVNHESNGRDAQGRFTRGNRGGPGNPFGRRLAQMRKVVAEAVSEEDLREVVAVLLARAKAGDVPAARLVLQYTVGQPQPAADPDRVDVEEWKLTQASNVAGQAVEAVALHGLPVHVASAFAEVMAPVKVAHMQQMMIESETQPKARPVEDEDEWDEDEEERQEDEDELTAAEQAAIEAELAALAPTPEEVRRLHDNPEAQRVWERLASTRSPEVLAEAPSRNGSNGAAPSPNGSNGAAPPKGSHGAPLPNGGNGKGHLQ